MGLAMSDGEYSRIGKKLRLLYRPRPDPNGNRAQRRAAKRYKVTSLSPTQENPNSLPAVSPDEHDIQEQ